MSAALPPDGGSRTLAPLERRLLEVVERREHGAYVVLAAEDPDGPAPQPGQFCMVAAAERWGAGADERPFLPRAFSVLRADGKRIELLLEDVGPGTRRLCELRPGDGLRLLGPLGRGFSAPPGDRRAILCGGGVGMAPLAMLQDELLAGGRDAVVLLGFRDAEHAAGAKLFARARVATDDGSAGRRGLVTELLAEELARDPVAIVYGCGPPAMLETVRALCERLEIPAQLALEAGMACGFGACYGCVVPLREGGNARVCVDGPVFDAERLASCLAPGEAA